MSRLAVRVQIAVGDVLVAEAVVDNDLEAYEPESYRLWAAWCRARWRRGVALGCAVTQRADLPRVWDVPVGGTITTGR